MAIVCLHGLGRTPGDWDRVRSGLEAFGAVRAPALPGDPAAALDCADVAIEAGDIVVGHSLGAILSLRLARERPRPRGAIVLSSCFFPPARNGRGLARTVADYAGHRLAFVRSIDRTNAGSGQVAGSARALSKVVRLALQQAPHHAALAAVTSSVLVVHARDDHLVPVDFALAVAARHPEWGVHILEQSGHSAHVHQPERWLGAVTPWLRSVQAVGGGSFGSGWGVGGSGTS